MNSLDDSLRMLKDAEVALRDAGMSFKQKAFRNSVMNSQIAIELSAKAVICCFEEPRWTHNPKNQLLRLKEIFNLEEKLTILGQNAEEAAPWHAKSVYGGRDETGGWRAAYELATREVAKGLLLKAKESVEIAKDFLVKWQGISKKEGQ